MAKKPEIYQKWKDSGRFDEIMEFIAECSRKLVSQAEMCRHLGIREETFISMRKKHPDVQEIIDNSKMNLQLDLMGALYRKAIGAEVTETVQLIEDTKGGKQKRKVNTVKKTLAPDTRSAIYLLTKVIDKNFHERMEELKIMEEKMKNAKEEWNSELQDDEFN